MTSRHLAALGAVALVLAACGVSSGRTVTVTHGPVTLAYVDIGETGPSVGDMRITEVPTQVDGKAGRLDAILTTTAVNSPEAGSEIRLSQLVFTFGNESDQVFVSGTSVYPAASATIKVDSSTIRPVIGGSGTYAGVTGWCESFHLADGTWRHVLHLTP
ncbi:MAG: hypothetical protein ACHQ15_02320 [Candidatus Limnocylindrales bacterium]